MIGDPSFDVDDENVHTKHMQALSVFKLCEDSSPYDKVCFYFVMMASDRRLRMVLAFVTKGALFWSTFQFVYVSQKVTKLNWLNCCNDGVCAKYVRIICAASLQSVHEILREFWGYSIALDVRHAQASSYMDVPARFCTSCGQLTNAHVVVLPLHVNNTAETIFNTTCRELDVLELHWHGQTRVN